MQLLRQLGISVLQGVWAGALILGIGGRLFMRAIAWYNGNPTGFSWGGTAEVVLLGAIIGAISAPFISFLVARLKWPIPLSGIVCGLGLYLMILAIPVDGKAAANAFPELLPLIHMGFGILFLIFGGATALVVGKKMG